MFEELVIMRFIAGRHRGMGGKNNLFPGLPPGVLEGHSPFGHLFPDQLDTRQNSVALIEVVHSTGIFNALRARIPPIPRMISRRHPFLGATGIKSVRHPAVGASWIIGVQEIEGNIPILVHQANLTLHLFHHGPVL